MARENEMQEFIRSFFRGRPDLSTLTHSIVRRRFLAHTGRDHLIPEEKQALKRLVEEELLKTQVDETGAQEKLELAKNGKRPPIPCNDPERKRFRFNSESEPSSAASSPDCSSPPAKNGTAAAISLAGESPQGVSKKAVESSDEDAEEQQRDLAAKVGLEEAAESGEEDGEGSARKSKVWKEESSEEEEDEGKEEKVKGRTRRKPVTKNKQAPGKTSASRKPATESEDSEEETAQRMGNKGAKSHQESEKESEEDEPLAKKKENTEEEDWKPRAQSNGGEKPAWEERNGKHKSREARLQGDWGDREEGKEKAAAGCGDNSGRDEKALVQKRKDRTQWKGGKRQSGSSEDEADSGRKVKPPSKGTGKTAEGESGKGANGEARDSEREVSNSEGEGSLEADQKNHSYRKSSKKSRTGSSSSADGSPDLKGRKASSGRRGEDHPAVMRLKRYIRACGAHRNYKKLLGSCHSHKERLSILRAELEALGMKGNPSLEKCRALKEQREEAAEVASLDIANIISGSGRPRRCTAWNPSEAATPGELYRRTLDSEDEQPQPPPPDWSHMRGIISSDGESD